MRVSRIEQYRASAVICAATDYGSPASVRHHNIAAKQMRAIVIEAQNAGTLAVAELLPLLDESPANKWIAFQLLELCELQQVATERCLAVIRRMARGSKTEALGAKVWLQAWATKKP